jgi:hypothetical protein
MKARALLVLAALLGAGIFWYSRYAHRTSVTSENATGTTALPQSSNVPGNAQAPVTPSASEEPPAEKADTSPAVSATALVPVQSTPLPETPESSTLPPATILENLRTTVRQYGAMFAENPVGTNPEITAALRGENPKHIDFLKPDGNRVNSKGELVDSWGTPYFFHQLSAHEMEIRSAGPDKIMYTGDDLVTR